MKLTDQALSSKLAFVVICLTLNHAQSQNLIQDGSFESPQQAGPGVYNNVTPADWAGGVRLFNGSQTLFPKPEQGNQYEGIENSSLSQTFSVLNAGSYLFTWYGNSVSGEFYSDQVTIKSGAGIVYTNSSEALAKSDWTEHSAVVNLAPGTDTITFTGGKEGTAHLIDNVSLVQVPETSKSIVLFSLSLLMLRFFHANFLLPVKSHRLRR